MIFKNQLTIAINFIFSKDFDEQGLLPSKNNNTECKTFDNVNDVVGEHFKSLLPRYQNNLKALMKTINFIFNLVQLWHCKCQKKNVRRGGSYICTFLTG